ncbi:M15 family metallopeptidase [Myroides sp. NP-2]|uniref:M15 family metallopeptidase n=1 Tax=Myroides sp. NP-2 TaxID=2759945 RepID=UPI0015F81155|nr:M15 family metallopeptidase [Myroides sp. NP-2]MBB1150446.1 M15 family metallopeptidase [Myroides sp. NP-2]
MQVLKPQMYNPEIAQWKSFLKAIGRYEFPIDECYDPTLEVAVKAYQRQKNTVDDGYIGNATWFAAYRDGMPFSEPQRRAFPLKPAFAPLKSQQERFATFGLIKFKATPLAGNPENITMVNDFEARNIVTVQVPQLQALFPHLQHIRFHRKGVSQLLDFFQAIERQGLLTKVMSFGGSYVPRLVRGSTTVLSNHAFGTAFDLNVAWNPWQEQPALLGALGSVREIVPLAHAHGFYWGGHFTKPDGMHFELVRLLE